eukprot:TRINITY_DN3229_c0_g1_i1.p1 TRINITY_DN3229_c0_g1~~TRINITY_DN3229_c0_g1_i1.p1  ORF type:complete len:230 (+),score=58.83 TRINITY_DN3229_c0_g1_i1:222-911(+)
MGDPLASNKVFVGGISWKADEVSLASYFSNQFGPVLECKIIMDRLTGKSKGYGFVTFQNEDSAKKVKEAANIFFLGKTMNVGDAVRRGGNEQNYQYPETTYGYPVPPYYQQAAPQYFHPAQAEYQFYGVPPFPQNVYPQAFPPVYYPQAQSTQVYYPQAHTAAQSAPLPSATLVVPTATPSINTQPQSQSPLVTPPITPSLSPALTSTQTLNPNSPTPTNHQQIHPPSQ